MVSGFRVHGSGFGLLWFRILGFWVQDFRCHGSGFWGLLFRAYGSRVEV